MEYSVKKLEKSRVEISVSLNKEDWQSYIKKAYEQNKHKFAVEGFRRGKVPFSLLVNRYGEEFFYEDAADIALSEEYGKILDKDKINVVARPDVKIDKIDADGLAFVLTVAVYPEFELGQYTGLKLKKEVAEVTDAEIDAEISREQEGNCRWIDITDRAVQDGDKVVLDYSGSVDGVKFEGGTAEKYPLTIGSHQFIPGFEEQIIGKNIDEHFDVKVTFPDDYHAEDLKGKEAVFECVVHEIKVKELPALDDEFAKDLGEFDTFKEYKDDVKARLQKKAENEAQQKEDNALITAVVDGTTVDVPEAMVEDEIDRFIDNMKHSMAQYGLKYEDYLSYTGATEEGLRAERRAEAERDVKTSMVLEAIIKKENLIPTKEEFDEELKKNAEEVGKTPEEFAKTMDERTYNYMFTKLMDDKLFAYLRANNLFE